MIRRLAAAATTAALVLMMGAAAAPTASATPTIGAAPAGGHGPLVCPTGTVNFETRGWWTPTGVSIDEYAGVDAEFCAPLYSISGHVPLLVHVQLRHSKGTINFVRMGVGPDGSPEMFHDSVSLRGDAGGDGEWYLPEVLDTTLAASDGWLEYRLTANMSNDGLGKRQYQSTGVQILTLNGKPRIADYRTRPYWEGRGWYQDIGYENVLLKQDPPTRPVSGLWSVTWNAHQGTGGHAITYHAAYVDANTHAIPMVLPHVYDAGSGGFSGTTVIDTRQLTDGVHRLLLRADARVSAGTDSGLVQILFTVQNGAAPTPTPAPTTTPTRTPTPTPTLAPTPTPSACGA